MSGTYNQKNEQDAKGRACYLKRYASLEGAMEINKSGVIKIPKWLLRFVLIGWSFEIIKTFIPIGCGVEVAILKFRLNKEEKKDI